MSLRRYGPAPFTDYRLEWTVEGNTYHRRLDSVEEALVKPTTLDDGSLQFEPVVIRYNPTRPSVCFFGSDPLAWKACAGLSAATLVAAAVLIIV
jgi:hypothetical protein